jgi:Sulfatase-modifying factor enzyme 1
VSNPPAPQSNGSILARLTAQPPAPISPAPNAGPHSDGWLGWDDFNNKFREQLSLGYYPESSAARCQSGGVEIRAHWVARPPGIGWYFFVLPEEKFNAKNSDLTGQGFTLRYDDAFECAGRALHQALWTKTAEAHSPSLNVAKPPMPPPAPTASGHASTPAQPKQLDKSGSSEGPLTTSQEHELEPGDSFKECRDCPKMIVVPAGLFTMGSPESEHRRSGNEGPRHDVRISRPFAVGMFHVMVDEFKAFVNATGYDAGSSCYAWTSRLFAAVGSLVG